MIIRPISLSLFFVIFVCLTGLKAQNNALNLPGLSNLDCGNNSSLAATNIKTLECWIKFGGFLSDQEILSKSISGTGIELLIYGGNLAFYCMKNGTNGAFVTYPTSNLTAGVWYHIAATWDGTAAGMALYVNGVQVSGAPTVNGSIAGGITDPAGSTFRIGNWSDVVTRYLNGVVDEARVWSITRTAAQIKAGMYGTVATNSTGLIAYYPFNEASGAAVNATGNTALNGSLVGAAGRVASPVQAGVNALNFDGVDDEVIAPANSALDLTTVTVQLLAKPTALGINHQELVGLRGAGGSRYSFHITNTGLGFYNGVYAPISYSFTNGNTYQLTFAMSAGSTAVYVNGGLVGTIAQGPNTAVTGQQLWIGRNEGIGEVFAGSIDEVRVWNFTMNASQVASTAASTLTGTETGLVAWYPFDQGIAGGTNTGLTIAVDGSPTSNNATMSLFALSGATSNYVPGLSAPLPVQFGYFRGVGLGDEVRLSWETAQEQNSSAFVVERSTDNRRFLPIGRVAAAGNSSSAIDYSYMDDAPVSGDNYYRIREVDLDGREMYSPVVLVNLSGVGGGGLRVFPNPARGVLNYVVGGAAAGEAFVWVTDLSGRVVLTRSVRLATGANAFSLETGGLSAGQYVLRVVPSSGSSSTAQFLVE